MSGKSKTQEFRVGQTFIIGLAFFSAEISWSMYNAQVPLMLENYIPLLTIIGIFMAMDNIVGVIIQPILGSVSDNTRTRYGRRMPYLMIGIPLGALFFALIPFESNLFSLLIFLFFFSVSMGFYRSQAVALMPDFVPPVHRSKGNAIINLMGGLSTAIGYGFSFLIDFFTDVRLGRQVLFITISIIMIVSLIILFFRIKEKESYSYNILLEMESPEIKNENKKRESLLQSISDIFKENDKSTLCILAAIFFWFIGYNGILSFISIYGENVLGYSEGLAGAIPFLVAVPLLIVIYPFALIATKIGRRKAVKIGVLIWISMLIVGFFLGLMSAPFFVVAIPLAVLGAGWAFINTNSIVILWELAPSERKIGTYTGLYYFSGSLAAILGPMILGFLTDLFTLPSLLLNGSIFFIIAFVMMLFVKRGEVELTEQEQTARSKAISELIPS